MTAHLRVVHAGPHVSFQDAGRPGNQRFGVPVSGPMDRLAHAAANLVVGNDPGCTAIEVSVGGVVLEAVDKAVMVAVVGGDFAVIHGERTTDSWHVVRLRRGERLTVRPGAAGSWSYVAVAGRLDAAVWLGQTATHSTSGLGGGQLEIGQIVAVESPRLDDRRLGEVPRPQRSTGRARVVLGPQHHHFAPGAVPTLLREPYRFSPAFDRMGVRLSGPLLALGEVLSIPSEPIVRGSVQVAGDGVPTLLFADHQTTGGYPKIATVISSDLDVLAQHRPGDTIRFEEVTPSEAVAITRATAAANRDYLTAVGRPGRTLAHRLMHENLIGTLPPNDDD